MEPLPVLRLDEARRREPTWRYEDLGLIAPAIVSARGVRFDGEPFEPTGGTFAAMRDPWNNLFVLAGNTGF